MSNPGDAVTRVSPGAVESTPADKTIDSPVRIIRVVTGNALAQVIAQGGAVIAGLGTNIILSRHLGPGRYGYFALTFAYVNMVGGIFAEWGLGTIAVRDASQSPEHVESILGTAAAVQFAASLLSYLALLLLVQVSSGGQQTVAAAFAGVQLLLMPITILALVMQVKLQSARVAWVTLAGSLFTLLATALATSVDATVTVIVAATSAAIVVRNVLLLHAIRSHLRWKQVQFIAARVRPLLAASWPLAISTIFLAINNQAPLVLLAKLSTPQQIGYFSAASKITAQLVLIPSAVSAALYPILSRLAKEDRAQLRVTAATAIRFMTILAVPIAVGGMMWGGPIAHLLYGRRFTPAGAAIGILSLQSAVIFPSWLASTLLNAMSKQRMVMYVQIGSLPALIGMCFVGETWAGSLGAAYALMTGTAFMLAGNLWAVRSVIRGMDYRFGRSAGAALVSVALLLMLRLLKVPDLLVGASGLILYPVLLYVLGAITADEINTIKRTASTQWRVKKMKL